MPQKVLVIDDSKPMHELVRVRLKSEPIDLAFADSGTEGLRLAAETLPDLILLDVDMPEPDGFEVCRRLKADERTNDIPVIFLTGASSTEQKLLGLQLGAIDYITKPFDPAELRARVRAALRTRQLMSLLEERAAVLQASEERFRFLAENSSDLISRHDLQGTFLYVSPACRPLLGYEPGELANRTFLELVHADDVAAVQGAFKTDVAREQCALTFRARRKDGQPVWLEAVTRVVRGPEGGTPVELHMTSRDVTSRKRAEALERGRARVLEMIAENQPLPEAMLHLVRMVEEQYPTSFASAVLLMDGRLEHIAPTLPAAFRAALDSRLLGIASEICGDPSYEEKGVVCSNIATSPYWGKIRDAAAASGLTTCWSVIVRSSGGDVVGMFAVYHPGPAPVTAAVKNLLDTIAKLITIADDHRALTYQLAHRAQHDSLTGLPNRLLFEDRLSQGIARAQRNGDMVGLLCIDLDRFKYVNDTLGHHAGDSLLMEFSRRVQNMLRQTDTLARLGGDEFSLIVPDIKDRQDVLLVAQKLMNVLKVPFEIGGETLFVTGSVGVAVFPNDGADTVALQKNADVALYRVKGQGRNAFQCFTADMLAAMSERLGLEKMLRKALDNNELELHYQPQIDAHGALVGVEALLRWRQPELGLVPPGKFISLAEETGLIVPIGEWVMNEACRQNKAWQRAGYPPIRVAVNVSTLQFGQPGFAELVSQVLAKHELEPRWLEVEITESLLMKNTAETAEKLNRVRNTGVMVAVDDFGTGYSSLSYLQQLPIDTLKIDRSFVQQVTPAATGEKVSDTAVIRAILSLGHSLGMHVVAEGVETEHQANFLRQHGCSGMQGFYFSKPKPPAELVPMFEQTRAAVTRIQPLPLSA